MRNHLFRLAIASSAASLGFLLVSLLTAYFDASPVKTPVQIFLPEVEGAQAALRRRVVIPRFQPELLFASSQRVIFVSGHIACDEGENVSIEVDLTQASTGAHAEGVTLERCTGEAQTWDAVAVVRGSGPLFESGAAQACAVAETRKGSQITDTHAWCAQVTLIEK